MDGEKVYLLLEFCSFGAIDDFLQKHSANFRAKLEHGDNKEVVSWCYQVADAMEFLVKNDIIHVSALLFFFKSPKKPIYISGYAGSMKNVNLSLFEPTVKLRSGQSQRLGSKSEI